MPELGSRVSCSCLDHEIGFHRRECSVLVLLCPPQSCHYCLFLASPARRITLTLTPTLTLLRAGRDALHFTCCTLVAQDDLVYPDSVSSIFRITDGIYNAATGLSGDVRYQVSAYVRVLVTLPACHRPSPPPPLQLKALRA